MTLRAKLLAALRAVLGVALLAWVLSDPEVWQGVRALVEAVWLLPVLAVLVLFGAAVEAVRLAVVFRSRGLDLSVADACRVIALGTFFNFCIPGGTGGDVMKLYYLAADQRGRRVEVATLLFVDRLLSLFSVLLVILLLSLASGALLAEHEALRWMVRGAWLLAGGVALATAIAWSARIRHSAAFGAVLARLPLRRYVERGVDALFAFRHHTGALAAGLAVSMVGHATLLAMFVLTAGVVLPGVPLVPMCLLSLLGMLANVLPLTPGGIGVGEAAFDELFQLAGFGAGSPLILAWRAAQIPLLVLGCLVYVLGLRRGAALTRSAPAPERAAELE